MEENTKYYYKALSALDKVFSDEEPAAKPECQRLTALRGETVSFQIAYASDAYICQYARVKLKSPINECVRVREVISVPCRYAAHKIADDNYLRTSPGMYPDLLSDLEDGRVMFVAGQWHSLWIDVEVSDDAAQGVFPITVEFYDYFSGGFLGSITQEITIYPVQLPKQTLIRTEWFHGDCLARYYGMEVFSEQHWKIMGNFIAAAVKRGCNMILTPHFTPPLDTAKGFDRTTIQLVDVKKENGKYFFKFDKLKRFVDMCIEVGMTYFEMSHLFTQWGATAAPKVMAEVNGEAVQIFGWDTPAVGGTYTEFLHCYLPRLTEKLKEWGIAQNTYFHISDEPTLEQLDSYRAAKYSVAELLDGFIMMDALSDYTFYETGAVEKPVCSNNHIQTFIEHKVENLWSYYCTGQGIDVSNRFFSMPSARNRIYGLQLFKYKIEGMLHWGYNFYNSQLSVYTINPYAETSAASTFPGGDPFLVYPKADGTAEESIRIMVLDQAMNDLRAMQLLASKIGREKAIEFMEEELDQPITFSCYPKSSLWLISFRNRVNQMLDKLI